VAIHGVIVNVAGEDERASEFLDSHSPFR